jgi:hypothetical protein
LPGTPSPGCTSWQATTRRSGGGGQLASRAICASPSP